MKRNVLFAVLLIAAALSLSSCDTKQASILRLEKLTHELYLESSAYTPEQWEEAKSRYEELKALADKYDGEMTDEERFYVKKLETECSAFFGKQKAGSFWESLKNIFE